MLLQTLHKSTEQIEPSSQLVKKSLFKWVFTGNLLALQLFSSFTVTTLKYITYTKISKVIICMRFLKIKETGSYTEFSKDCHIVFFWPLFLHKCLRLILLNLLLKIIGVLSNHKILIFYLLRFISWFFKGSLTQDFPLQVFFKNQFPHFEFYENLRRYTKRHRWYMKKFWGRKFFHILLRCYWVVVYTHIMIFT